MAQRTLTDSLDMLAFVAGDADYLAPEYHVLIAGTEYWARITRDEAISMVQSIGRHLKMEYTFEDSHTDICFSGK